MGSPHVLLEFGLFEPDGQEDESCDDLQHCGVPEGCGHERTETVVNYDDSFAYRHIKDYPGRNRLCDCLVLAD